MVKGKLLDTNILIDYLRNHQPTVDFVNSLKKSKMPLYVSAITRIEIYAGQSSCLPNLKRKIEKLLKSCRELPIDGKISTKAGSLKRDLGVSALDAIIASTALKHKFTLVTRNIRHFAKIQDVKLEHPN